MNFWIIFTICWCLIVFIWFAAYLVARIQYRLKLKEYAAMAGPIVEFTEDEEDVNELLRCQEHREYLQASGNNIFKHFDQHDVIIDGQRIYFIHAILFRDRHPAESWNEYLDRREVERLAYVEKFHECLRGIGKPEENLVWYEKEVLRKNGAHLAKDFISYKTKH